MYYTGVHMRKMDHVERTHVSYKRQGCAPARTKLYYVRDGNGPPTQDG